MNVKNYKLILILSFAVAFCTYSFWQPLKECFGVKIFYPGISLSFVGYTYVIKILIEKISISDKSAKPYHKIANIIFLSASNNMIDEIFFDPTKMEINEYIGFIIIIILTYFKDGRFRKNTTKRKN